MKSVFFGPCHISGIGQVTRKYASIVHGDYVEFGEPVGDKTWDIGFAFVIPIPEMISIMNVYKNSCKQMIYYTICETEPVNEDYGKLLQLSQTLWTSSEFCSNIFKKQFPNGNFPVLHLYASPPRVLSEPVFIPQAKYIFYHIGNIIDPRKNIHKLIECFYRADIPDSLLILKASCNRVVKSLPRVVVINEFLTQEKMESLHEQCHCYVSLSHSEGAGMGAVEAAMRNKPVIFQEYGGTKEYIPDSPFVVSCTDTRVGMDDFLFKKEHVWGQPNQEECIDYMKYVAKYNIKRWEHPGTRAIMSGVEEKLKKIFSV